jgi:peptidoglycan/LPS O-acetylase OafA/YrhL
MSNKPPRRSIPHLPALDGVRGLAILTVFCFHVAVYGWPGPAGVADGIVRRLMQGGWIGVDLFFALSGYLITGILVSTRDAPAYFRNFYVRRALRIFPLYYFALAAFALLAVKVAALHVSNDAAAVSNWTYTSNIYMALRGWDVQPTAMQPFWSLAVEEQFYLIWPVIVLFSDRRRLLWISIAGVIIAILVRIALLTNGNALAAYMLLPARMDSLLAGSIVGLTYGWTHADRSLARRMTPTGIAFIAGGAGLLLAFRLFAWHSLAMQALKSTLIALGCAAVLTLAIRAPEGALRARFFTSRPLRFLGRYSYSIYVFHAAVITGLAAIASISSFPTLLGSRLHAMVAFTLVSLGLTTLLALATWHLIEKHFLALKSRFDAKQSPARSPAADSELSGFASSP